MAFGQELQGSVIESICQDDYADSLQRIARGVVVAREFTLDAAPANPAAVSVEVDGAVLKRCNGMNEPCDYELTGKILRFTNPAKVPDGRSVWSVYTKS